MKKFNIREFIKLILIGIIINTIIFFLNKNSVMYYSNQLNDLIIKSFGTLGSNIKELLLNIIVITLNVAILMYKYCDYIIKDIDVNGKYIFTRNNKREKWIVNKYLEIIKIIIIYYFIIFIIYILLALINGFQIGDINNSLRIILSQYIICVLVTTFNIVATNFIGFKLSAISSFSIVYSLYIVNLIAIFFLKEHIIVKIIGGVPFGVSVLAWNNYINESLNKNIEWFNVDIIDCNILYLAVYLIILIVMIIIIQRILIKNKDLV